MDVYEEFAEVSVCRICNESECLDIDQLYDKDDIQAHYFCLLFSSGLEQKGKDDDGIRGFMPADIRKEIKRGARLKCVYCHKKGATVGCAEQRCKKSYHLPCGNKHDSLQQHFDQFKSFCKEHRPTQKPGRRGGKRSDKSDNICTICQEKVVRKATYKVVWTPCCEEFFHKECVQNLARHYGAYHFRCPHCQNQEDFVKEMQVMGIYIPVQDASWETGNDFNDIDEAPPHLCHAKICFCPSEEGRAYNKEHGLWEVLPCQSCGSRGIHAKCGGLEDYPDPTWYCYKCRGVMNDKAAQLLPHTDKLWSHLESSIEHWDPQLVSKLDSLRTQENNVRQSPEKRQRSDQVLKESSSSPNKLFEALLATLPHLPDIEDSLSNQSQASITNKKQVEMTIFTKPSSEQKPGAGVQKSGECEWPAFISQPHHTGIQNPGVIGTQMIPLDNVSHSNVVSVTALPPPSLSSINNSQNGFTNGNHNKIITNSKVQTNVGSKHDLPPNVTIVPATARQHMAPNHVKVASQVAPMNLSNKKKQSGDKQNQRQNTGTKVSQMEVDKGAMDLAIGKTKKGTKDVHNKKNGIRKEIYDYTLEDIIRSRLNDNGDINTVISDPSSKTNAFSKISKDGIQVNGISKKTAVPVFRILNGDSAALLTTNQRKIPDYFPNRK